MFEQKVEILDWSKKISVFTQVIIFNQFPGSQGVDLEIFETTSQDPAQNHLKSLAKKIRFFHPPPPLPRPKTFMVNKYLSSTYFWTGR